MAIKPEQAGNVDHAGDKGEQPGTGPNPGRQLRDHGKLSGPHRMLGIRSDARILHQTQAQRVHAGFRMA
jgi:hypothetical protein